MPISRRHALSALGLLAAERWGAEARACHRHARELAARLRCWRRPAGPPAVVFPPVATGPGWRPRADGYPYDPFADPIKTQIQLRAYRYAYLGWSATGIEENMTPDRTFVPFSAYRPDDQITVATRRQNVPPYGPFIGLQIAGMACFDPNPYPHNSVCSRIPNLSEVVVIVTHDYHHSLPSGTYDWDMGGGYQAKAFGSGTVTLRQVIVNLTNRATIFDRDLVFPTDSALHILPPEWCSGSTVVNPNDNVRIAWVFTHSSDTYNDPDLTINIKKLPGLIG